MRGLIGVVGLSLRPDDDADQVLPLSTGYGGRRPAGTGTTPAALHIEQSDDNPLAAVHERSLVVDRRYQNGIVVRRPALPETQTAPLYDGPSSPFQGRHEQPCAHLVGDGNTSSPADTEVALVIRSTFNNLLIPILGYARLALDRLPPEDPTRGYLRQIDASGQRAASIVRQLLAFSSRQIIEPRVIPLDELVVGMSNLLRRLIGEDIELVVLPRPDAGLVRVDPGQMEQVVVNLAVNARDAMSGGGKLTIETTNVSIREEAAVPHPEVPPGEYVTLAVSDTGVGMTSEVKARIFEPFFTTKEIGKGTGLGLSTCYGIVAQSGGHIAVYSQPGKGTTFNVQLPRVDEPGEETPELPSSGQLPANDETVMLAEDEPFVREIAARVLRGEGYKVIEAANGVEAMRLLREHGGQPIDLLFTDMVMPLMGGRELAEEFRKHYGDAKVLYTSGYTDDEAFRQDAPDERAAFMRKPFTPAELAGKVRRALDE